MAEDSKPAHTVDTEPRDADLAELMLGLIAGRREGATICPSEVARAATGTADAGAWRALMPRVRDVAADLAERGLLRVTQRGRETDARQARGPLRLGRPGGPPPSAKD